MSASTNLMLKIGMFGTCRISSFSSPAIRIKPRLRHPTTAANICVDIYDNDRHFVCQPLNYTTKLRDVLDALSYLHPDIDFLGGLSMNDDESLFRIFCRGHSFRSFLSKEMPEPGSYEFYDFIVIEVCSVRRIKFSGSRLFAEKSADIYIPWNIALEEQHSLMDFDPDLCFIEEGSFESVISDLKAIKNICSGLLVVGPYLLPYPAKARTLFGDDDDIPIEKINSSRFRTAELLKKACACLDVPYIDMSSEIENDPSMLRNQYHFSPKGENILYKKICNHVDRYAKNSGLDLD